ncbi:MAG: phosphate-starvation-inducible PsiE family protein [Chromatiales bacterium]|nr:phosphate-starvation-inducible PsiE family protein [Chromatiales bacterium]
MQDTENKSAILPKKVIHVVEHVGLAIILIATIVAIGEEVYKVIDARHVNLADLLLLFIYLEVVAMVGIYYESHRLPVRYPIYIAIVALARYVILDSKDMSWQTMMGIGGTMLLLAFTILAIRYGHTRMPYGRGGSNDPECAED